MESSHKNCDSARLPKTQDVILQSNTCPVSKTKGKSVKLITLKSLLTPKALATLDAQQTYYFCKDTACEVVYFSKEKSFSIKDLKVKVHQKDKSKDVPVCYCFDWTPNNITQAAEVSELEQVASSISAHIKAGRCGCEVNNPQGSCCLGNVNAVVKSQLTGKRDVLV